MAWRNVAGDIMRIEREAFGKGAFVESYLRYEFQDLANIVVVLLARESARVVGFTIAGPVGTTYQHRFLESRETAYISDTVIEEASRGQGLVGLMMTCLEAELKMVGYRFVERHAAVEYGYADKIARHYGDRVMFRSQPRDSEWGPQVFFRIRL